MSSDPWHSDNYFVEGLPARYRAYASYSRLAADNDTRHVRGGSFLLRAIRDASRLLGQPTTALLRGIDGLVVKADFADERILEVVHEIRGENPEYDVMRRLLTKGDVFIDVGANFGTFSLLASRLVGESGRVIAIEPQPRLAAMIRESLTLSNATNVELVECACGAASGEAQLMVPRDDSGRAGLFAAFSGRSGHATATVPMRTLDEIAGDLPGTGNVVLKIDVEGSEIDVLEGGAGFIRAHRPVLIVEHNPWSATAAGHDKDALMERLRSLGYGSILSIDAFLRGESTETLDLGRQLNLVARTQ